MTDKPEPLPDRLALLPDINAARYISTGVRAGREDPPYIDLSRQVLALPDADFRFRVEPVRDLIDDVMHLYKDDTRTKADAWLAPRLHATLRLTRREAADEGLWNHLALAVAPDYLVWRHLPAKGKDGLPPMVSASRFRGAHHTQAFSRLWWAAELFRNGADYGPAVVACGNQDVLNTVLRLDVIDHRPTAQALIRLVEQEVASTGREVNALATVANAAASTLLYDVLAADDEGDGEALHEWVMSADSAPPVARRSLPQGPGDIPVPEEAVHLLAEQFRDLFQDAPVRGRTVASEV
ncbi:DUF6339 family protein [Streptomyces sp. NBC_01498]|uniref:DUF6339 family protein n=1 Tax=Streptomyces sp. NBC_01498 TaxID=2975870 RepID=UPI002E7C3C92|nr:DUF6339 family protein [Streptomyces sp. NBC_01498]WTL26715.1 DUF6339 family protein [Streptomyces sp. NBC_01498]